MIFF
jgi:DNA-directed RNA polymerase specialized sigma24 family protein